MYAFLNDDDAVKWITSSINGTIFGPVIQQIKSHNARLCILQGDSTRIACNFSSTIRHIKQQQLKQEQFVTAFWSSGTSELHKQLIIFPDPEGSVLIPDFIPRTVSLLI